MKKVIRILLISGLSILGGVATTSCSLEPTLSNNLDNKIDPITDAASMSAAVNGVFARMASAAYYGRDIIIFSEVRNSYAYGNNAGNRFGVISDGTITSGSAYASDTWGAIYRVISECNRIITADVPESSTINALLGQAYTLRALAHYDLLRLYGQQSVKDLGGLNAAGIPYITVFGDIDAKVERGTAKENMDAIFADLQKGIDLLASANGGTSNKVKINETNALGLQSRIALYFSQFDASKFALASSAAEKALALAGPDAKPVSRSGFLDSYKGDGIAANSLFEIAQSGTDNLMTNSLYNIYNYAQMDNGSRVGYGVVVWNTKTDINDFFKPMVDSVDYMDIRRDVISLNANGVLANTGKYTASSSNIKMLRVEELMFNYIEAFVEGGQGSQAKALDYLNAIVSERITFKKTGSKDSPQPFEFTAADLATVYKDQRMKELMFEGFGFEDVVRWKQSFINPRSEANTKLAGGVFSYDLPIVAFPIPTGEINVSKIAQNEGY